jgi:hypothetical protein
MLNRRKQVILVITDGEPNDPFETEREATLLKNSGVLLVFVAVGNYLQTQISQISKLASPPSDKHVFQLTSYRDLIHSVERVLSTFVMVAQWVRRAKCSVDIHPYQVVPDLDAVPGIEVLVPGWAPVGSGEIHWKPQPGVCIEDAQALPWVASRGSEMPSKKPKQEVISSDMKLSLDVGGPSLMFPNVEIASIFKAIFNEHNEPLPAECFEGNAAVNELLEIASKGEVFELHDVRTGQDGLTYRRVLKSDGDGSFRAHVETVCQGSDLMLPEGNYSRA